MLIERYKVQFRPDPTFLLSEFVSSGKIFNLAAKIYTKPNLNSAINKKLSFGSKIRVIDK